MADSQAISLQKLQRAIKAEPKKAAVLAVLAVVMVGAWFKLASRSGGPSPAAASAAPGVLGDAPAPARTNSAAVALAAWLEGNYLPVGRNLFAVKLDYYPQDSSKVDNIVRVPQGNGFWDQLKKSMTVRVDQEAARKILEDNLRLQARQMDLQTVVLGASPKALIDGQLVGLGGVVRDFRVVKIEARQVVVEKEGMTFNVTFR